MTDQRNLRHEAKMLVRELVKTNDFLEFIERMDALTEQGYNADADPRSYKRLISKKDAALYRATARNAGYTTRGLEAMLFDLFDVRSFEEVTTDIEGRVHTAVSNAAYARYFSTDRKPKPRRTGIDLYNAMTAPTSNPSGPWRERIYEHRQYNERR